MSRVQVLQLPLLKVNQIGSITESILSARLSLTNEWGVVVSHRSGKTEYDLIADLVVGFIIDQIKAGVCYRSASRYIFNQLLRVQEELDSDTIYAGLKYHNPQA
uniref:Phosphopyruvate hydratase n=1 Tax=Rhabditophanes sp. KR3021 TaxID=114890 RepID=A0AC35U833_9BILA